MRVLAILRLTQSQSTFSCLQKNRSSHGSHHIHPGYLFLKFSFGVNFGHLLKKYAFSVASLIDSHEHEGFIYTKITEYSEMTLQVYP